MIYYRQPHYDRFNYKVIEPPVGEPVSVADGRDHLLITPFGSPPVHPDDAWIQAAISAAREWCEGWSMCALVEQTLELGIAAFPHPMWPMAFTPTQQSGYMPEWWHRGEGILLPMGVPFIEIVSVKYDDSGGIEQTMDPSAYYVNDYERPPALYPAPGTTWPVAQQWNLRAVRIRYRCGYSLAGSSPMNTIPIPFEFIAAIKLVLGHLYENRENSAEVTVSEIPMGATALMQRFSARIGMA